MKYEPWIDDDHPDDVDPPKMKKRERIEALELRNVQLRKELDEARTAQGRTAVELRDARGKASAAEMTVRNVRAALQMLIGFASDEPAPMGTFYIDPQNGQVTRVPVDYEDQR